jgi:hypothetical protein
MKNPKMNYLEKIKVSKKEKRKKREDTYFQTINMQLF